MAGNWQLVCTPSEWRAYQADRGNWQRAWNDTNLWHGDDRERQWTPAEWRAYQAGWYPPAASARWQQGRSHADSAVSAQLPIGMAPPSRDNRNDHDRAADNRALARDDGTAASAGPPIPAASAPLPMLSHQCTSIERVPMVINRNREDDLDDQLLDAVTNSITNASTTVAGSVTVKAQPSKPQPKRQRQGAPQSTESVSKASSPGKELVKSEWKKMYELVNYIPYHRKLLHQRIEDAEAEYEQALNFGARDPMLSEIQQDLYKQYKKLWMLHSPGCTC